MPPREKPPCDIPPLKPPRDPPLKPPPPRPPPPPMPPMLPPPPRPASVVNGAASVETRRQIPKTKSFELIIIDKDFMRLDTDDRRKSHYFFCDIRKNAHNCSVSVDCR